MNKYILGIEGMVCEMCEIHVKEAITNNIDVEKAKANRFKKELVVICKQDIDEDYFHQLLDKTGYQITSYERKEAVKSFFSWK